jgi:hypothetical protein
MDVFASKKPAGGILLALNEDKFEVISFTTGTSYISAVVVNKFDSFCWQFVGVYGIAYADHKLDFLLLNFMISGMDFSSHSFGW